MMLVCNSGDYDGVNGDNKDFQGRGYAPTVETFCVESCAIHGVETLVTL